MKKGNGWGAAKSGKVVTGQQTEYKQSNVKSSRDLNGLYSQYQGKTLGESKKES